MQKLEIKGGRKVFGTIKISGSKNATLPILASTILTNKKIILKNVPIVKDVLTMVELLRTIGSTVKFDKKRKKILIFNKKQLKTFASYHLLKTMRAGVLVLGPLLAKYRIAKVSLPGGCAIGSRPINYHLDALKKMGAKIKIKDGYIFASAKKGLKGCKIKFPNISVGATENILIAACFAKGETKLRNCAIEPEINDLIYFLKKLGCKIKQVGKRSIDVSGVEKLKSVVHNIIFDRIETGTYIIAAGLTKGRIKIKNINPKIISTEINILNKMGVDIIKRKNYIIASRLNKLKSINIITKPYPGFPTDLQAQIMVLLCKANKNSTINNRNKARAVAEKVIEAMGGWESWKSTRYLRFSFFGFRTHYWDKDTGRYRVSWTDRGSGHSQVILMNLNSKKGKVYTDGIEVTDVKTRDQFLERARRAWINDTYWLLMPYKLFDPGVELTYSGEEVINGTTYDILHLSFNDVGVTPGDEYWAYINRETSLMDKWVYLLQLREGQTERSRGEWKWNSWRLG